jgi:hypothetical protein
VKHLLKVTDINVVTHVINTDHVRHMIFSRRDVASAWYVTLTYADGTHLQLVLNDAAVKQVLDRCE